MSTILRTMDKVGMVNQTGFEILIQILSLKIFDEKRNEKTFPELLISISRPMRKISSR